MIYTELPPPPLDLQAELIDNIRFAVCNHRLEQDAKQRNLKQKRLQKRKRCLQDEGPSYSPREREGLKRLRSCSEATPVQSPRTGSWSLETRDTILNDTDAGSGAAQSNYLPPAFRLPKHPRPYTPARPNAMQPKSILRQPRSSHTDESDDNASDWSDCTSDSGYSDSESTTTTTMARSGSPAAVSLPLRYPPTRTKTVHFDHANLRANHATFRALGCSDNLYATLSRQRKREVVRKALAHILRAFADTWDERRQRERGARRAMPELLGGPEALRVLDECLARQAQEWEERFREWDARVEEERDREEEKRGKEEGEAEMEEDAGEGEGHHA